MTAASPFAGGHEMNRSRIRWMSALCAAALVTSFGAQAASHDEPSHEVWLLDQSNTYDGDGNGTLDSGGTLYIYQGSDLAGNKETVAPEVIPLGGALAEAVRAATGTVPVRPHYIAFNKSSTHAIISFVATGHVLIIEAATRT